MVDDMMEIVRKAGKIILDGGKDNFRIKTKTSARDVVTDRDEMVQKFLIDEFSKILADARFVGEENVNDGDVEKGYCFIIDPIDGTANYSRGCKYSCISAALALDGKPIIGVVYNPYLDEMFSAVRGEGAYLNGERIYAGENHLENSIVCFGTCPYNLELTDQTFSLAKQVFKNSLDLRRSGSSALDICYTACGRFDLFFELILCQWDYAAAWLIVEEAGGVITDTEGNSLKLSKKCPVVSAGRHAHADFMKLYEDLKKQLI